MPRYVELRGFTVLAHGRLTLKKRDRAKLGTSAESDPVAVSASFVTFFKGGTNPTQSGVGTYIKIPWTPEFDDLRALVNLTMPLKETSSHRAPPTGWRSCSGAGVTS